MIWRMARPGTSFCSVGVVATADGVGKSLACAQLSSDQLRFRARSVLIDNFPPQFLK